MPMSNEQRITEHTAPRDFDQAADLNLCSWLIQVAPRAPHLTKERTRENQQGGCDRRSPMPSSRDPEVRAAVPGGEAPVSGAQAVRGTLGIPTPFRLRPEWLLDPNRNLLSTGREDRVFE